jgi:hypothetical protein
VVLTCVRVAVGEVAQLVGHRVGLLEALARHHGKGLLRAAAGGTASGEAKGDVRLGAALGLRLAMASV